MRFLNIDNYYYAVGNIEKFPNVEAEKNRVLLFNKTSIVDVKNLVADLSAKDYVIYISTKSGSICVDYYAKRIKRVLEILSERCHSAFNCKHTDLNIDTELSELSKTIQDLFHLSKNLDCIN